MKYFKIMSLFKRGTIICYNPRAMKFLIYGRGYLGEHFLKFLKNECEKVVYGEGDIGNLEQVQADLTKHSPDVVINCAGRTGRPNVDWCEDHKEETFYANVTGPLVLAEACHNSKIKLVHLGSGCIYEGDNNGRGFTEKDAPNFDKSFYSKTKKWSEELIKETYPDVLQLRLRMPIDANTGERNFISKIIHYEKNISVPNSMTVIEDFLPAAYALIKKGSTGIYNMTNPGSIDHQTILNLYKEIVDQNFEYELMSLEEMYDRYAKAGRSNCILDNSKLKNEGIHMRPIDEAIRDCIVKGFKKA